MIGLTSRADVYTEGSGGLFTTLAKAGLACRFVPLSPEAIIGRGLPAQSRKLLFDAAYAMPSDVQLVDADGQRWNARSDTLLERASPFGGIHHRSVTVVLAADD